MRGSPQPARRSRRQVSTRSSPDTRAKILRAGRQEFAEHGLAGARVDRIARRAGVNKAMIYYHFSSKEALYDEILAGFLSGAVADLRRTLDSCNSLGERVAMMAEFHIGLLSQHEDHRRIVLRELADPRSRMIPKVAEVLRKSGVPAYFRKVFREGIRRGELRSVNVKHALASLVCMNVGFMLMAPIIEQTLEIGDMKRFAAGRKEAVMDLFTKGVKKR